MDYSNECLGANQHLNELTDRRKDRGRRRWKEGRKEARTDGRCTLEPIVKITCHFGSLGLRDGEASNFSFNHDIDSAVTLTDLEE